jgi:hypothetical protein
MSRKRTLTVFEHQRLRVDGASFRQCHLTALDRWSTTTGQRFEPHSCTYRDVSLSMNELTLLPFSDGRSNDQFLSLVYFYRKHGLSIEETVACILRAVSGSPDYSGSLSSSVPWVSGELSPI